MNDAERVLTEPGQIRAVIDSSSLVSSRHRHRIHEAAVDRACAAVWSPWIIAELNRVLTWLWIEREGGDLSASSRRRYSEASKAMMTVLLPAFELVAPLPPYPPAWESLTDAADIPVWAAARMGGASYVVSENRRDYPPVTTEGRHVHDGIEYLSADAF